ncbi:extracellular solute-binding protein, partial [Ruminococcaceae bacterium OttesenSCG-928-D13]|nr:extracellular solute-binding protein [Ruminococcaceae bacterium OttesenSCG-928-D13]
NGDWVVGEMAEAPRAEGFEWGFTAVPAYEAGGDRYAVTWLEQCWMPAGAENKDAGKQFMAYLYSDEAAAIFGSHDAVQPVQAAIDSLSEAKKPFYGIYSEGAKPALGGWAATEPIEGLTTYDTWFQPVNSLVSGDKTMEQYKADILDACARFQEALL